MDVKQMTYILTIAQEGGISKAAAKLFITQSALDQQLLKLEHELGTRLFFRSRSSFALTEAGRVYVEYARRMLELKNEAYRIIHDIAGRRRGTLSLAFAPERGMEMFMAVYPRFYQSYPEVTVTPREISVRRQLEMLAGDELDLGFISRPDLRPSPAGGVPAHHAPQPSAGGQGRAAGRAPDGAGHGVPLGPDLLPHLPLLHPAGGHRPPV